MASKSRPPGKNRCEPAPAAKDPSQRSCSPIEAVSGRSTGGYYRDLFTREELRELENHNLRSADGGVAAEIDMVRSVARRVLSLANGVEELDKAVAALNSLGCAAVRISRLIEQQRSLAESTSELEEALSLALREIREEFGLDD